VEIVGEMAERLKQDAERELAGEGGEGPTKRVTELVRIQEGTGLKLLPWWLAQPYWRPLKRGSRGECSDCEETTASGRRRHYPAG